MPRYVIYGAGAIGSILGAELYRAGKDAVLIGRTAHVQAIRESGLELRSKSLSRFVKINALDSLKQLRPKPDDRVLITVKSQDTASAGEALSNVYGKSTPVVALQNAVRNEEILAQRFPKIYGGLVEFCGNFLRPGVVEHTRNNLLALGRYPEGFDSVVDSIASDCSAAGFRVERQEHVMALKWWKLVLNVNNALLAILDCWLQKAQSDPEVSSLMAAIMEEALTVLRKAGIEPQPPEDIPSIDVSIEKLRRGELACAHDLPREQRTYPSTWQDLTLRRGKTEALFLNGEIERIGQQVGVATPRNSTLLRLVNEMASLGEPPGKYSPTELRSLLSSKQVVGGH